MPPTRPLGAALAALLAAAAPAGAAPYTTYLWHLHQPIYWPDDSPGEGDRYERAFETIQLGHSESDVFAIFDKADRVAAYQWAPRDALASVLDLPRAGAQVSFAGALVENVSSLAGGGWNGGTYAPAWSHWTREAMGWTDDSGFPRLDAVLVGAHHAINPLLDENAFRMELRVAAAARAAAWGASAPPTTGFFPAEMCFSERMIAPLAAEGVEWVLVPDIHVARACADYPANASLDNCDPPNRADQVNPAQGFYHAQTISRGVTTRVPPFAFRPHRAEHVDPETGAVSSLIVVPVAMAMSWNEGYGPYGTGDIDALLPYEDPAHPFLFVFAHDGDNAWSGGHSYYYESVSDFCHAADALGWEPATVARYLADHPSDPGDVVHVEDGGWVNADGDFGSPQFINWNWPLVDAAGAFDIPNGWAEDERNWAVLTAAQNRVETAEAVAGPADAAKVWDPAAGAGPAEKAWHFLLAGYESGYMYYGTSLDMEVKATLACNRAVAHADPVIAGGGDPVPPTVWLPQRLPWNPGGFGGGSLWGYPGGSGAPMPSDFHVWTFAYDVSGLQSVELRYRIDTDGTNPLSDHDNETYAGGPGVGPWQTLAMNRRPFPAGNVHGDPGISFSVLPAYIADEYWVEVTGLEDVLVDYHVEAVDSLGNVKRTPIQHVWVGAGTAIPDAVTWTPEEPAAGGTLTVTYDAGAAGVLPPTTDPVYIHVGHSGWQGVLSPDPAMTASGDGTWSYTYAVPFTATQVDLAFTDGAGTWDNHGGADWHVPVTGAAAGFQMDGALDAGVSAVAAASGHTLWAAWNGTHLYVATEPAGTTTGLDHFVLVAADTAGTHAAPWSKAGTVAAGSGWFLGNEESNGWAGWFDLDAGLLSAGSAEAVGSVLEGTLDAATLGLPEIVYLAVAHYETADLGALVDQVPSGDDDGLLEAAEWMPFPLRGTATPGPPAAADAGLRLTAGPNPFRGAARIALTLPSAARVRLDVVDVAGRVVAVLGEGRRAAGTHAFTWNGRTRSGSHAAAGVYWVRGETGGRRATTRLVKLP
jgi:hypothetical protein